MAALDKLTAGRTTFFIAPRLSVARDANMIAAFEAGKLAELGTHEELLAADGVYAGLWNRQVGVRP